MPIFSRSRNSQVCFLHWQRQILVIGIQIPFCLVGVPSLLYPFLYLPSANRRKIFEFHPWLNTGKSMGAIVYRILLGRHECEEVVRNFLFLGAPRTPPLPPPTIAVSAHVHAD